ncbi:hypothetical protein RFI_30323 [Reticulomyxa filosa]|uniref:Uncharacterized protein n=1 Tax=Reticulomyxa filosa TaxID=46433 RepID=X6LYR5_RETFI|nr:hypothetical protein RFI_30323 [Reticulomyxa filosa]|eukprot:ETO07068.1 hypothetical protein RFI_30323 [Reticulomyxa filosa]
MEWRHDNKQTLEPIKVHDNSIEFDFMHETNVWAEWNDIDICRGVKGILVKPKFFQEYFWNASEYFIGCWWDDDNFNSFNFERQGIARKEFRVKRSPQSSRKLLGISDLLNREKIKIKYQLIQANDSKKKKENTKIAQSGNHLKKNVRYPFFYSDYRWQELCI